MAMIFFLYSFENSLMNTSEMSLFLVRMVYIAKPNPNPNAYLPAIEIIALLELNYHFWGEKINCPRLLFKEIWCQKNKIL